MVIHLLRSNPNTLINGDFSLLTVEKEHVATFSRGLVLKRNLSCLLSSLQAMLQM